MIQKRRVHSLNWFHKNCELDSSDRYCHPDYRYVMYYEKLKFVGKLVTWDSKRKRIKEDNHYWIWQEWMFEPKYPFIRGIKCKLLKLLNLKKS